MHLAIATESRFLGRYPSGPNIRTLCGGKTYHVGLDNTGVGSNDQLIYTQVGLVWAMFLVVVVF